MLQQLDTAAKQQTVSGLPSTDQECWSRVKGRLKAEVGDEIFSNFFVQMNLDMVENEIVHLSMPTQFLKSWVESHYADRILSCWQAEEGSVQRIKLSIRTVELKTAFRQRDVINVKEVERPKVNKDGVVEYATTSALKAHEVLGGSPLDPRLTLETFVVGRSNTLAHAAAKQVAVARKGDVVLFNPLYIHARTGLGKTHLLQAVAWMGNADNERKVLYLTAEKFMYGFVMALKGQSAVAFKEALRGIDVLLVDDLQFLAGRNVQTEFQHTLNALLDAGRQVVVGADRSPYDLDSLDDRLRSRLATGLVIEIGPLGEELRTEMLQRRIAAMKEHHPAFEVSDEVVAYVAKSVTSNGRDLEGALNRLLAHSKLSGQPVTMGMAERETKDMILPLEGKRVKIEEIQRLVARQYNVSRGDLVSSRRTADVVRPRQIAMYLAKILTLRSFPEIGRRFGGRDHTTVLHAVRRMERLIEQDSDLSNEIELLKRQLAE